MRRRRQWKAFLILPVAFLGLQSAALGDDYPTPRLLGDKKKAEEVWVTVKDWSRSYVKRDLKAVMAVFDPDEVFSFAGGPDAHYAELEADYRAEFAQAKSAQEWIPIVDEVYAEGKTAFVRGISELHIKSPDGKVKVGDRNRCIDVYRLSPNNRWLIFRTLCYPEPLKAH
jgi:ketosteroid isomerase-like protein